jgi:hypothetical protein
MKGLSEILRLFSVGKGEHLRKDKMAQTLQNSNLESVGLNLFKSALYSLYGYDSGHEVMN